MSSTSPLRCCIEGNKVAFICSPCRAWRYILDNSGCVESLKLSNSSGKDTISEQKCYDSVAYEHVVLKLHPIRTIRLQS